jgi:hypothetical protein
MFRIFGGKDTLFGDRQFICSFIALGTHCQPLAYSLKIRTFAALFVENQKF